MAHPRAPTTAVPPGVDLRGRARALVGVGVALLLLSACGGQDFSAPPPTTPAPTYGEYQAVSTGLHTTWDGQAFADPATLPISGNAKFSGVAALRIGTTAGERQMNGSLSLVADFSANALSGSASAFSDANGAAMAGTLAVTNGILDRAANPALAYTFNANMDGTLSGPADSFAITSDISGDFLGASYGAMAGAIAGTALGNTGSGYLFGDFVAAR